MWINKVHDFLIDLIFPCHCLGCGRAGSFICKDCLDRVPLLNRLIYPDERANLNGIIIATDYRHFLVAKAIKYLKYKPYLRPLGKKLSLLLIRALERFPWCVDYFSKNKFILVPLPLTRKKLAGRGFNQAELLAKEVSTKFGWPLAPEILKKIKNTPSQTDLTRQERKINVKGAFKANQSLQEKNIILVDDIFTTGATLEEAARVLRQAGAKEIWGLVLAKG